MKRFATDVGWSILLVASLTTMALLTAATAGLMEVIYIHITR